jgi:hypothetical protein
MVATSEQYFRSSWLNALNEDEIAVSGPGDAEVNALKGRAMGIQSGEIAASRPVCLGCQLTLRNSGVVIRSACPIFRLASAAPGRSMTMAGWWVSSCRIRYFEPPAG